MSSATQNRSRIITVVAVLALALVVAHPAFADALDTANTQVAGKKEGVKTLMQTLIAIGSIVCVGCGAWTLLMDRNTKVIVAGLIGLVVAGVAGAVISTM